MRSSHQQQQLGQRRGIGVSSRYTVAPRRRYASIVKVAIIKDDVQHPSDRITRLSIVLCDESSHIWNARPIGGTVCDRSARHISHVLAPYFPSGPANTPLAIRHTVIHAGDKSGRNDASLNDAN